MNINDVNNSINIKESNCNINKIVTIKGVVIRKEFLTKKDNSLFLKLSIRDQTGMLICPIWDNINKISEMIKEGTVIQITGKISEYNEEIQISNNEFRIINDNPLNYIPKYKITNRELNYFNKIVNNLKEPWKSIVCAATGFNTDINQWNSFLQCPCSEKHQYNKLGGLFIHTITLVNNIIAYINNYINKPFYLSAKDIIDKDRLITKTILHDIGKLSLYKYNDGIIKKKEELNLDKNILGCMYIKEVNTKLNNILNQEQLDNLCYSILSQSDKYPIKNIEDKILALSDILDSCLGEEIENPKIK